MKPLKSAPAFPVTGIYQVIIQNSMIMHAPGKEHFVHEQIVDAHGFCVISFLFQGWTTAGEEMGNSKEFLISVFQYRNWYDKELIYTGIRLPGNSCTGDTPWRMSLLFFLPEGRKSSCRSRIPSAGTPATVSRSPILPFQSSIAWSLLMQIQCVLSRIRPVPTGPISTTEE